MSKYHLEVVSRIPPRDTGKPPLLFIHGAFTAAWCWDEHFLPYFCEAGYPAYALSLRGHGGSEGRVYLNAFSIHDYVEDVASVARNLPGSPVMIGHSMGGFILQKYLHQHEVPGAAMLCSVPPQGLLASSMDLLFTSNTMEQFMRPDHLTLESVELPFAQPIDEQDLVRFQQLFQPESQRAMWDMAMFGLGSGLAQRQPHPPMLVVGAACDKVISPASAEMVAKAYGVGYEIFPELGHGVMLEKGWQQVADSILNWLKGL